MRERVSDGDIAHLSPPCCGKGVKQWVREEMRPGHSVRLWMSSSSRSIWAPSLFDVIPQSEILMGGSAHFPLQKPKEVNQ